MACISPFQGLCEFIVFDYPLLSPRLVLSWFLNKNTRQNRIYPFILRRIYIRRYKYFTPTELLGKETSILLIDGIYPIIYAVFRSNLEPKTLINFHPSTFHS